MCFTCWGINIQKSVREFTFVIQVRKECEDKGEWTIPTKSNEEGMYTVSMDFLREAENHCILQSPIPITCPVRLIHGLKDEDVPWHISMQVAERVLSPDVDIIMRRHGQHRMAEKDDIKLIVYTIDDLIDKLTTMVWNAFWDGVTEQPALRPSPTFFAKHLLPVLLCKTRTMENVNCEKTTMFLLHVYRNTVPLKLLGKAAVCLA